MKQVCIIILALIFVACKQGKIDTKDTELDSLVSKTDSSNLYSSKSIDTFKELLFLNNFTGDTNMNYFGTEYGFKNKGLISFETFHYNDSTKKNLWLLVGIYKTKKYALTAFRDFIDFWACCIPDEDIVKLKNFNNVNSIKNVESTVYCSENIVISYYTISDIIKNPIEQYLKDKKYYKLDIAEGGPAKWTIKK